MLAFFCSVSVAANQQKQTKPPTNHEQRVKAAIDAFVDCMYASGDTLALGTGSAMEIATAALGECGREHFEYGNAVAEYFVSSVSRRGESKARARAQEKLVEFTHATQRMVVGRVVRLRDVFATMKSTASVFSDCAFDAAETKMTDNTLAPSDIADAALRGCHREYEAFRAALRTQPHVQGNEAALLRADAFAARTRNNIVSDIISDVLAARNAE